MSLPGTNAHRNAMPRRTSVQRHQRIPYAQSIAPYPQSSVAMFSRASNAVMESLSWPQKQFLKWVRTDVVKAATAAEDHLNLSDHNSQEPIWPQAPPSREPSKAVISSLDRSSFNPVLDTLERSTINVTLLMLVIVKVVRHVNFGTFDSAQTTRIQVIAQEHDAVYHMSMKRASRESKPRFLIRIVQRRPAPL
ncbi:hypothetical protein PV05_07918 [Exophiala xenobiotica]|uniref:Uncharacterized protein n=1 Tax=Exophiala xenobiotica TaxID=348802 RepID=A0A0D2CQK3_9EURO|nr:uncharacterized protein PV05_07918 [Exophiala xenobiotica]KIW52267.1 hypothetical protein PV05_07918 [Exophiala xenobiotica]